MMQVYLVQHIVNLLNALFLYLRRNAQVSFA